MVYLNIPASVECGQIFRWIKENNTYFLVAKDNVFELKQESDGYAFIETSQGLSDFEIFDFLGTNHNLEKIYKTINKDEYIKEAIKKYKGMRIFKQDPWECLMTYICSSNSSIPNIEMMANNLSKKFGEKITYKGRTFYTYPKVKEVAGAKLEEIKKCKLGFRSKYLLETSKKIDSGEFDLEPLKKMSHQNVREELIKLPGIGYKIADCISLFGFQNFESFPVDVWTARFMKEYYGAEKKDIQEFVKKYFGEYAGYAQEYLFYKRRTS